MQNLLEFTLNGLFVLSQVDISRFPCLVAMIGDIGLRNRKKIFPRDSCFSLDIRKSRKDAPLEIPKPGKLLSGAQIEFSFFKHCRKLILRSFRRNVLTITGHVSCVL